MTPIFKKCGGCAMHNDFTVFKRRVPSGKKVVYYYAYGAEGSIFVENYGLYPINKRF
jgi:hypothetical protein